MEHLSQTQQLLQMKVTENVTFDLGNLMMKNAELSAKVTMLEKENEYLKDEMEKLQNEEA